MPTAWDNTAFEHCPSDADAFCVAVSRWAFLRMVGVNAQVELLILHQKGKRLTELGIPKEKIEALAEMVIQETIALYEEGNL